LLKLFEFGGEFYFGILFSLLDFWIYHKEIEETRIVRSLYYILFSLI